MILWFYRRQHNFLSLSDYPSSLVRAQMLQSRVILNFLEPCQVISNVISFLIKKRAMRIRSARPIIYLCLRVIWLWEVGEEENPSDGAQGAFLHSWLLSPFPQTPQTLSHFELRYEHMNRLHEIICVVVEFFLTCDNRPLNLVSILVNISHYLKALKNLIGNAGKC